MSLLIIVPVLGACYAYHPLSAPTPGVGQRIAVELTDRGMAELAAMVGPGVTEIRGRLVEQSPTAYHLAVTAVVQRNGEESYWKEERIAVPLEHVSRVSERRLAKGGTALTAAGIVLAILGVYGLAGGFGGEDGGMPPPIE